MDSEARGSWLPLTEYSAKYKISLSTIRRRIKAEDIKFKFTEGKYFIIDEPMGTHQRMHRPSQDSGFNSVSTHHAMEKGRAGYDSSQEFSRDESIIVAANKLLDELKRAYSKILQEKEQQILQLRSEVAELKTMIRDFEAETKSMKNLDI